MKSTRRLMVDLFSDQLSEADDVSLRERLERDEAARAEHDHVAALLRAAAGQAPARRELDRWKQGLMARIDAPSARPAPARRFKVLSPFLAPLLAAAMVAALTVSLWVTRSTPRPARVQTRGGAAASMVNLEIHAIAVQSGARAHPRPLGEEGAARLDEFLQFRYTNHDPDLKYLFLVGLDYRLTPLDYYPRPARDRSIDITEVRTPRSVGRSIRLAKRHEQGPLWIYALFSKAPLLRSQVHEKIDDLRVAGTNRASLSSIDFGPGVVPVIRRVVLVGAH